MQRRWIAEKMKKEREHGIAIYECYCANIFAVQRKHGDWNRASNSGKCDNLYPKHEKYWKMRVLRIL